MHFVFFFLKGKINDIVKKTVNNQRKADTLNYYWNSQMTAFCFYRLLFFNLNIRIYLQPKIKEIQKDLNYL
jgi:hypothetical protein